MKPTLFILPFGRAGLPFHTYGLAIAVGFALGVLVAARRARREGIDGDATLDLLFWILVAGVLGSRVAFVALNAGAYATLCTGAGATRTVGRMLADCAAPLRLWEGGLVFQGGALAATGAVALFARRHRWRFGQIADVLAPALALGHAVGRLGCFFAGCCFGKTWTHGLSFPRGSVAFDELVRTGELATTASQTLPLHPTQLYEAAGELIIFLALSWASNREPPHGRQRFSGAIALLYAGLYSLLRFGIEMFRGDIERGFVVPIVTPRLAAALGLPPLAPLFLSTAQLASVLIGAGALGLFLRARSRATAI